MLDQRSRRRRGLVVAAVVVLLVAVVAGIALRHDDDNSSAVGLTVTWGGSEGIPSCRYDPLDQTVDALLTIEGEAPRSETITVTVTAYADENTSQPVGSSSRSVPVEGTMDERLVLTIEVDRAPHIDDDGIAACALSVRD